MARTGPDRRRAARADADLSAEDDTRASLEADIVRVLRHARLAAAGVGTVNVVRVLRSGWAGDPLPLWVAVAVSVGGLLAVNVLSLRLDTTWGQTRDRRRVEALADLVLVTAMVTVAAPLHPAQTVPVSSMLLLASLGLRLPLPTALAWAWLHVGVLAWVRGAQPLPWPVGPTSTPLGPLLLLAPMMAWMTGWLRQRLLVLIHRTEQASARERARSEELGRQQDVATRAFAEADAQRRLAEASAARFRSFSRLVAHELRNPLASITGLSTTAARPDLPDDERDPLLARLPAAATRASRMLDDLYRHAEAETAPLHVAPVDLEQLIGTVRDDLTAELTRTGSTLTVAALLPRVLGDPVLLERALTNLVANAVRHGGDADGRAEVTVTATQVHDRVTIRVSDRGGGIDPDVASRLFTAGARGDGSRGLGIGLASARTIVERHGGTIEAERHAPGVPGVTFAVTLHAVQDGTPRVLPAEDGAHLGAAVDQPVRTAPPA